MNLKYVAALAGDLRKQAAVPGLATSLRLAGNALIRKEEHPEGHIFSSYEEFKSKLQPGDVLLTHFRDPNIPTQYLVQTVNPSPYSHASLYAGGGKVVDNYTQGVKLLPLMESVETGKDVIQDPAGKGLDVKVLRPLVSKKTKERAVGIAKSYVGTPYDTFRTPKFLLPAPEGKLTNEEKKVRKAAVVCSQLVARAYPNVQLTPKHPDWTLPIDLERSDKLKLVGTYKGDPEIEKSKVSAPRYMKEWKAGDAR